MNALGRRRDAAVCALVFVALLGGALAYNLPEPSAQNATFAWEYGNTAAALATGRGFSDPFEGLESGPTAWMPPAYVMLIAGVFAVFGVKSAASLWVLLVIKYVGLVVALGCLLRLADAAGLARYRWWMLPAFLGPLYVNRYMTFLELHDPWLHLLLSCALLLAWVETRGQPFREQRSLVALAVLLPLASPSLAAAYAVLLASRAFAARHRGREVLACAVLLAIFVGSAGIWTVRNVTVLGAWIPVKSNLWFDFVQANEYDDDGLVTNTSFLAFNPSNPNEYQVLYASMGEAAFTARFRERAAQLIRERPLEVLRRVARRAWSAFVFLHDPDDARPVSLDGITDADLEMLRVAGMIKIDWAGQWVWLCLSWPEDRFVAELRRLAVVASDRVLDDWRRAHAEVRIHATHWTTVVRTLTISTIPTLFLLAGLAQRRVRRERVFAAAAAIYLLYLTPYVLVSHYLRYQTPMIGLQAVFSFFAATTVLAAWRAADSHTAQQPTTVVHPRQVHLIE